MRRKKIRIIPHGRLRGRSKAFFSVAPRQTKDENKSGEKEGNFYPLNECGFSPIQMEQSLFRLL